MYPQGTDFFSWLKPTITNKSSWEGCTSYRKFILFNLQKRWFSFLLNITPFSMLGYNRTIARTNIKVLFNIGPETAEEGKEKEVKTNSLPNTFDDDCSK